MAGARNGFHSTKQSRIRSDFLMKSEFTDTCVTYISVIDDKTIIIPDFNGYT